MLLEAITTQSTKDAWQKAVKILTWLTLVNLLMSSVQLFGITEKRQERQSNKLPLGRIKPAEPKKR